MILYIQRGIVENFGGKDNVNGMCNASVNSTIEGMRRFFLILLGVYFTGL
jgi:hypothetical protein